MKPDLEDYFNHLVARVFGNLHATEMCTCNLAAEQSSFVRLNRARVRQAGTVDQAVLQLNLITGAATGTPRQCSASLVLNGDMEADYNRCAAALNTLRTSLPALPPDPLCVVNTEPASSRTLRLAELPDTTRMVEDIVDAARGLDLVGFLASGPVWRGFANSLGQSNWHATRSFNFSASLYLQGDKAVKTNYAGFDWNKLTLHKKIEQAREQLPLLARPAKALAPRPYRVYLAPAAVSEIINLMGWGGFSAKAHATRQSPLQRLSDGRAMLSPLVSIAEHHGAGLAPPFQSEGYACPKRIALIEHGRHVSNLVAPRTAREYGLQHNGAGDQEAPLSLDMAGGTLASDAVMEELGSGLWISNLWYLNYSDRSNGRITGMSRYASFWVDQGRVVAPVAAMRFDDTLYRILGSALLAVTRQRQFIPDDSTYHQRSVRSARLPGIVVDGLTLTL